MIIFKYIYIKSIIISIKKMNLFLIGVHLRDHYKNNVIYFNYFYFHHLDFEHILLIHYPRIIFFKYSSLEYGIFIGSSSYNKLFEYGEVIQNEVLISSNIAIK